MAVAIAALVLAAAPSGRTGDAASAADVQQQIESSSAKDRRLRQSIAANQEHAQGFAGRIGDLRQRLDGLQTVLTGERHELASLQRELRGTRARLVVLRQSYVRDRRVLARQLVSQYEAPRPDLVSVVLQAHGFAELLETADRFKAVADHNAMVAGRVRTARRLVGRQATRLTDLEARQARTTGALSAQRDQVAQLKLAVVERQLVYLRAQHRQRAQLTGLRARRGRLRRQLAKLQATQGAAIPGSGAAGTGPGLPTGGAPAWSPHAGAYGFFQAAGTNYSVGDTPRIAARLDYMGKALHLHLIGLSGYRTPQHSVEVGGFANDPHTKGQASDTPGLEGVPEATLNAYGLTRPFGGVAELDHVQLVGSI
ncbi:hypothetical protein DSM112329_04097 [Paraconexibacter sp. AEG42_29]|uniref:Uncharacterized protein n=1 Tax=Paraconexibacter sp. AEG42_29 TaxID=2997339 RepID=A0AAU7B029_9ACTN